MLGSCWDELPCSARELQACAQDGDRSLLPWRVAAAIPACHPCLSCLPGWWQGLGQPKDWWEIYKIQPVPACPCYRGQAGGRASLFVEGQLSPWLPAHTQPCSRSILPARLTACPGQRKLSQEEEGAVSSEDLECFSHLIW